MRVLINGKVYNSLETPILLVFDTEYEEKLFGMKRFVSAPEDSTEEFRQELIDTKMVLRHKVPNIELMSIESSDPIKSILVSKGFDLTREIKEIPYVDCVLYEQRIL